MKKSLLLTIFTILFTCSYAQQEEYGEFLQNAKVAAENGRIKEFNTNFRYFVAAMYREEITPESLTKENFDLFSECILYGITNDWITEEDLKTDIVTFLEYDIENHPSNMGVLGTLYLHGKSVPQDYEKARSWFEKGAERDDVWSTYELGVIYNAGTFGATKYMEKAKMYYQKAAELGSMLAISFLANGYAYGIYGYEKNIPKAIELYKDAIEKAKDPEKGAYMSLLGSLYQYAKNDKKEAENWYNQAKEHYEIRTEKGDVIAMWSLGNVYQQGLGVEPNTEKAKEWYRKSCEAGFETACQSYEALNK